MFKREQRIRMLTRLSFLSRIPEMLLYMRKQSVKHRVATTEAAAVSIDCRMHRWGWGCCPPGMLVAVAPVDGQDLLLCLCPLCEPVCDGFKNQLCLGGCRRCLGRR